MQTSIGSICATVGAKGRIDAEDVLALRRCVFSDDGVSRAEGEQLFDIAQRGLPGDPEWPQFFVEALTHHIVEQVEPRGYVSEENADWLIGLIEKDGRVCSATELELVLKLLEKAVDCTPRLERFALETVKEAVLTGNGPTRHGTSLRPGVIGKAEVEILRRVLYASGGSANVGVSRLEAEVLFDIEDATLGADNDPSWSELFMKAIAHHVIVASGYTPPPREEALRRERWLEDTGGSPLGFFSRMLSGIANPPRADAPARAPAPVESVSEDEALWLRGRILRNSRVDANQRALLDFIKQNADVIHPSLRDIADGPG